MTRKIKLKPKKKENIETEKFSLLTTNEVPDDADFVLINAPSSDRQVNIRVPLSIMAEWDEIKSVYGNNLTQYINKLILADLKANKQMYLEIVQKLQDLHQYLS